MLFSLSASWDPRHSERGWKEEGSPRMSSLIRGAGVPCLPSLSSSPTLAEVSGSFEPPVRIIAGGKHRVCSAEAMVIRQGPCRKVGGAEGGGRLRDGQTWFWGKVRQQHLRRREGNMGTPRGEFSVIQNSSGIGTEADPGSSRGWSVPTSTDTAEV